MVGTGWYDVPDYARMLLNVPLVVYSGEHDAQMAPARWMEPVSIDGPKETIFDCPGNGFHRSVAHTHVTWWSTGALGVAGDGGGGLAVSAHCWPR